MRKDLQQKRDKIIKKAYEDNKRTIRKGEFVEMFSTPVSVPSLYRIIKVHNMNINIINNAIKLCKKKKPHKSGTK